MAWYSSRVFVEILLRAQWPMVSLSERLGCGSGGRFWVTVFEFGDSGEVEVVGVVLRKGTP